MACTVFCLALLPMRMNPLAVLGIWVGSEILIIVTAIAIDEALWRRQERTMRNRVVREARRVLRESR
jgi:hypothetical protein